MPYYPMYAFCEKPIQLPKLALAIAQQMQPYFNQVRLEIKLPEESIKTFTQASELQAFVQTPGLELLRFQCQSELHQIEIWPTHQGYDLKIDLWDFPSDLYDEGLVTASHRKEKRQLVEALHGLLLNNPNVLLTYLSNFNNKFEGDFDTYDLADLIRAVLSQPEMPDTALLFEYTELICFLGLGQKVAQTPFQKLMPELAKSFKVLQKKTNWQLMAYQDSELCPSFISEDASFQQSYL
ncbi:MAG: hypothetical protein IV090_16585 [Candidatus Sericytochromatia bacterium]|nr:hypothetical protein [Candidatus Sericytochromatia bacterium]